MGGTDGYTRFGRRQLNSADQGQIIEKHREVFAEIRNFGPEAPNYVERTRKRAAKLDEEDAEVIATSLSFLFTSDTNHEAYWFGGIIRER